MSGLAGLWNLDGRPADRGILSSMAAAIAHRGGDHSGMWIDGSIGFACQLFRVTPESATERQPLTDPLRNTLVFDGRLDNRIELLAAMPATACAPDCADSDLVSAAWRQWGDGSLAKLNGDFALALFDERLRSLVLARDAVGCRPLYYWRSETRLVFASEIKAILSHPDVRAKPNHDLIADLFLLDQLPYEDDGDTYFDGVSAVLPGQCLVVTPSHVRRKRFWDFDTQTQVGYGSYQDYAQHLRELLVQAVTRRARTSYPVAVSHSGGLDSSVVLCIADDLCRSNTLAVPLLPASYAPLEDPETEENRFIHLLESERGLQVRRLGMGEPGEVEQLKTAAWHSEAPVFDCSWCAETPLLAYAHERGARTLLTGLWSDQVFFVMGYLADLFERLAWREIARHLDEYRKWFVDIDAAYFRSRLARELFLNLTPGTVRSFMRPFRTAFHEPRRQSELKLSRDLVARARRRRPRVVHPEYATAHARSIYQVVRAKSQRLQFEAEEKMAARFGLQRMTPFLDRDVLAFLMSIPGEIQTHHGVPRALLRDAMRGIAPEPILQRRWPEEGTVSAEVERAQRDAYLSLATRLRACRNVGFCSEERVVEAASLELIGLEFWSRVFFSDTLG